MTIVKESGCDPQIVSGVVEKMVEGAKQVTDVGAELTFILPSESSQQFPQLFDTLEGQPCYSHALKTGLQLQFLCRRNCIFLATP